MVVKGIVQGQLALALPLLAAILPPMAAGQNPTCTSDIPVKFTGFGDPMEFTTSHVPKNTGFRGLVVWMHRVFGEFILPTEDPEKVILLLEKANSVQDVVSSLLFATGEIVLVVAVCFTMAVIMPLLALGILCTRYSCGLCGGGSPSGEPENSEDSIKRQKWTAVFYLITTLMTFMLICASFTKDHLPVAVQGAKDQANFLVNTMTLIFDRLHEDLDVVVGVNLDKFQVTAGQRAVQCRMDTATIINGMSQPGTVLDFFTTTAERVKRIQERLNAIDSATTGPKISSVLDKTRPASAALQIAAQNCAPPCDPQLNQQLTQMAQALAIDNHIALPRNVKDLQTKLATDLPQQELEKIPTPKSVTEAIDAGIKEKKRRRRPRLSNYHTCPLRNTDESIMDCHSLSVVVAAVFYMLAEVSKAIAMYKTELRGQVDAGHSNTKKVSVEYLKSLSRFQAELNTMAEQVVTLYQVVLGLTVAVMAVIAVQYIIAIYAGVGKAKRGFCGLYTASWMLSIAVVLFQMLFSIALLASTAALVMGTIVDRFVCIPAQDPGSPSSLAIINFLINKGISVQTTARIHSEDETGVLFVAPGLMQHDANHWSAGSRWQRDRAIRNCASANGGNSTSPVLQQRSEQGEENASSQARGSRQRQPEETIRGSYVVNTDNGVRNIDVRAVPAYKQNPNADVASPPSGHRRIVPDSPQAQGGSAPVTRDTLSQIAHRFSKCSTDHLSYLHLFGDQLTLSLTRQYMGAAGDPLIAIIDKDKPLPNIDSLAQLAGAGASLDLGAQIRDKLSMISVARSMFSEITNLPAINDQVFQQLADAATQSKTSLMDIENTKIALRNLASNTPIDAVKRKIEEAADELTRITTEDKNGFGEEMDAIIGSSTELKSAWNVDAQPLPVPLPDYVRDFVLDWDSKEADFRQSVTELVGKAEDMKAGIGTDLENFFRHTRTQLRDYFGDCHAIYVLYITTVDTACDGAVRLFAGFWFSVWWYLVLGIPGWMVALAMSTFYARLAAVSESTYFY